MTLLFADGFAHYATATLSSKYQLSSGTISTSAGRFGPGYLTSGSNNIIRRTLAASHVTLIAGFAVSVPSFTANNGICAFLDTATLHVDLRINTDGSLTVTRNGTVLGTSATNVIATAGVFYYIEFKATIDDSAGTYDVVVNGTNVLSGTGADTRNGGLASANQVALGTGSTGCLSGTAFSDFYVLNTSGSAPTNTFLGDTRVQTLYPTGAGTYTDFTPSTGANWQNVDDTPPNGDTDYNSSSTLNGKDSYATTDLVPTSGTVYGVVVGLYARKDDAGARSIAPFIRNNSTDSVGTNQALSTSYNYGFQIYETNPSNGSAAWTITDVNASEIGAKITV